MRYEEPKPLRSSDKGGTGWGRLLLILGGCAFFLRQILLSGIGNSAILYLAVPFGIALLLYFFTSGSDKQTTTGRYLNLLRDGTIIMLATSFILFEGFICVFMFLPIYYFALLIGFAYSSALERSKNRSKTPVHIIPLIVLIMSSEGVFTATTSPRASQVTFTQTINASVAELKENMAEPIVFDQRRSLFLSIFPLPTEVKASSLKVGDIHSLHFVYKRWFFTNIQEGDMHLLIADVGDDFVRTEIIGNSTYLDSYMSIDGTEVRFTALEDQLTEVSITLFYERKLDPAWYFGTLQRIAMHQSAEYLIDTIIQREFTDG